MPALEFAFPRATLRSEPYTVVLQSSEANYDSNARGTFISYCIGEGYTMGIFYGNLTFIATIVMPDSLFGKVSFA